MLLLLKYLLQANSGRKLWRKIQKKYGHIDEYTRYILFPENDDEYNAWAIYFLNSWAEIFRYERIFVISSNESVLSAIHLLKEHDFETISIPEKQIRNLIRLAGLVNMMASWSIVSVKQPYDTGAERMLGKKGITKKEIVWYDMLQIREPLESKNIVLTDFSKLDEKFRRILGL